MKLHFYENQGQDDIFFEFSQLSGGPRFYRLTTPKFQKKYHPNPNPYRNLQLRVIIAPVMISVGSLKLSTPKHLVQTQCELLRSLCYRPLIQTMTSTIAGVQSEVDVCGRCMGCKRVVVCRRARTSTVLLNACDVVSSCPPQGLCGMQPSFTGHEVCVFNRE